MTPEAFVDKWRQVSVKESAAAHSHFEDLCELLGVEKPLDTDPGGDWYAYERHVSKAVGGKGFADVWKKGYFASIVGKRILRPRFVGHHPSKDLIRRRSAGIS